MKHWIEITKEAFEAIVDKYSHCIDVRYVGESMHHHYNEKGCNLKMVTQYTSNDQYYIQDINA